MTIPAKSSMLLLWAITFTLLVANFSPLRAQAERDKPADIKAEKDKEAAERKEFEKKTVALLNDVAAGAWGLKLPENRLFVMTEAADLLWPFDEKRARTIYWDAVNTFNLTTASVRGPDKKLSPEERVKLLQAYISTFELRQKLVRQAARQDPQLALEILRATRHAPPPRSIVQEFPLADNFDVQLEQAIAAEIAARDPAQALQLARQSLAKGITFELLNFWERLNQRDSEKASQFAGDLIAKLRTVNLSSDLYATIIAVHLLQASRAPSNDQESRMASGGYPGLKRLVIDDEQRRNLVEVLVNDALGQSGSADLIVHLTQIKPEIEKFFPERQVAIERKLASLQQKLSERRIEGEYHSMVGGGTPEAIVQRAATSDVDNREMLYRQAALTAVASGNTDSFRELLNKEISNEKERNSVLDYLDDAEVRTAAGLKQLDRLQRLLPKIRGKTERAEALGELALMLKEKGQNEEAAAMLDEAAGLIKADLKDEKQTNALLTLLVAYAVIDPPKAFALAERTVDNANRQISLLLLLDKIVKSGSVKKNEIVLEQAGMLPLDYLVFKYGKGMSALAKADFNRTRALAERFERNELRLMAQLLMLKGMLQPESSSDMYTTTTIEVIRM